MTDPASGKELLAAINATLNGTSGVLLVIAWIMIKRRNIRAHGYLMASAVLVSTVFLGFYLTSYFLYGDRTSGLDPGALRTFYFVLLASHVLLAIIVLPMVLATLWMAYRRNWRRHRLIARPTFFIWMYVSVTGVAVYWMLYHLFPGIVAAG